MSGYTLNGVAGRIRDLENKVGGAYYVALCWLAMARNSGKGSRKLLEGKIFGQDKPTSTFRNAWRIAEKSFAEGFHANHRKSVEELTLDDAVEFAVNALEAHRTALGATNMALYEERCKYATEADIPQAAPEAEAEAEAEAEKSNVIETSDDGASDKMGNERTPLENAVHAMMQLGMDDLVALATKLNERLADVSQTEEVQKQAA